MSFQSRIITNIFWSFGEQLLRKGSAAIITLVLAWFLTPDDYGLVGVVSIFLAVSYAFVEGGFRATLIRRKEVTQLELSTVFYANIVLSIILYALVWCIAPWIADFYEQARLTSLFRVAGLSLIFQSLTIVHSTVMQRNMQFKLQVATTLPAAIFSGVGAVILAYLGFGVWSIILQMILFPIVNGLLFWKTGIWKPSREFSFTTLRNLSRFSLFILLTDLQREFFAKMYVATIAKSYFLGAAGFFFFAEKVRDIIVQQLVTAVHQVTYPALSQIQEDGDRLLDGYRKIIQATIFVIYPIFLCISALAVPIFDFILPHKWLGAAPYVQIMLISALLVPLHRINGNIIQVKNKPDWMLRLGLFESACLMGTLLLTHSHGVYWILLGHLMATTFVYLVKSFFTFRLVGYSLKMQVSDVFPTLLLAAGVFGAVFYASNVVPWPSYVKVIALGIIGAMSYLLLSHMLKINGYSLLRKLVVNKISQRKRS